MPAIRHRVGVNVPAEQVYATLSTLDGLRHWWTRDVRGDDREGKNLEFYFGGDKPAATMRVAELRPSERVVWECVDGPKDWVGTTLTFELYPGPGDRGETVVKFTHGEWREPVEFLHHCTTRWGQFLISLKTGLEDGRWQPDLEMPKVSNWD
jgi:uncharacterized protein YndB with AHSA1/START domain